MYYEFKCPKCGTIEERSISISKYDELKNKQICDKCNSKMERVLGFDGSISLSSGMYGIDSPNGGWNS